MGGARLGPRVNNRLPATVLRSDGSGHGLPVVDEEVFGPVLTVHAYDDLGQALRVGRTRATAPGRHLTDSLGGCHEAFDRLDVGALIVNDVPSTRVDAMPTAYRRDSGIGREGVSYAIEEMTDHVALVMRLSATEKSGRPRRLLLLTLVVARILSTCS